MPSDQIIMSILCPTIGRSGSVTLRGRLNDAKLVHDCSIFISLMKSRVLFVNETLQFLRETQAPKSSFQDSKTVCSCNEIFKS